ncbi:hypothetical protein CL621_00090 [archaeon]|jgi:hypothetical protein|nr:hypothetical protein [archaeon]
MRKCKNCKDKFEPKYNSVQEVCSYECAIELNQKRKDKEWKKEKKVRKEALKTREDYFQETLKAFNAYIRARDKNEPCISCDKPAGTFKLTSGHFYPQGTYRNIALDERNAHGQCWYNCNKNQHGNLHEYRPRLINKIGLKEVELLDKDAQQKVTKYTIPELKELKELYKKKIKEL